ncbi:hypothetical protein [Neptunicoccus cionae]|uniref:Uncharacterized protein n=1 Tax=Neptunicoccus cionae TaxID=2035344 RepID=A0A916QSA5_9RHOB|nr:hypothetical protein [Amylibacter cionae]GGA07145.1 hypothetical protein GCM10011498_03760 [Amylibacter cionae]
MIKLEKLFRNDAKLMDKSFFDEPWLENALDRSLEKTLPEPQSTKPRDHLSAERIRKIEKLASRVASEIDHTPRVWQAVNGILRGYGTETELQSLGDKQKIPRDRAIILVEKAAQLIA